MTFSSDADERAHDEQQLAFLNCWEDGWSVGEIGRAFNVSRNVPLGVVHRVNEADPTALLRKPEHVERRQ